MGVAFGRGELWVGGRMEGRWMYSGEEMKDWLGRWKDDE